MRRAADKSIYGIRAASAKSAAEPDTVLLPEEVFAAAVRLINRELLPAASAKRQRLYGKVTRVLTALQRKAQRRDRKSGDQLASSGSVQEADLDVRTWGLVLRRRRERAGLSRRQLADLADVADSTIRNIETGRHTPTRIVVSRLRALPTLNLPALFIKRSSPVEPRTAARDAFRGHCWITPGFDAIEQSRELVRILRSSGGRLDPALLFLEPASAAAWCAHASVSERLSERITMPLADVASAVSARLAGALLDVLGLGAGEAHAETSLVKALRVSPISELQLLLLDSSPSLLAAGFRHASSALASAGRAVCFAVQGDMRKLPSYGPLLETTKHRLVCLFGDTFSTLDNEATFARHSLGAFRAGDLLLLDVPLALAETKDEPHLRTDALSTPDATLLVEFLTGPLRRNITDVRSVELCTALDHTACIIPGSYAVEYTATVRKVGRDPRRFSLYHAKRYDIALLAQSLARMGWDLIERWPFGDTTSPRALLLLQKRA